MDWFRNLKVFYKIVLILVVYAISFVITTYLGTKSYFENQQYLGDLENKIYDSVLLGTENVSLLKRSDEMFTQAVSFSEEDLIDQGTNVANRLIENVEKLLTLDKVRADDLNQIKTNVGQYLNISRNLVNAMMNDDADFGALSNDIQRKAELFETTNKLLADYKSDINQTFRETIGAALQSSEQSLYDRLLISFIAFVILGLTVFYVGKSISNTTNQVRRTLKELAVGSGNLSTRIQVVGQDELGRMAFNFNNFMDKLTGIVQSVMSVSSPLMEAANDLDSNNKTVRQVSEDLMFKAKEAKQAMDEITQSISEISTSATDASAAIQATEERANQGLKIVNSTIQNSKSLNSQIISASEMVEKLASDTEKVANILDVISSIAEQTNLLALNAAIEAARAGEQGRGFAVVADEVRALASKTGDATTEIREVLSLLEQAASSTVQAMASAKGQSEQNEKSAVETGDYLQQIRSQIENVNTMNMTIATAVEEQTMVVANVSDIITTMHDAVESTEESLGEMGMLADKLLKASDALKGSTSQFQL